MHPGSFQPRLTEPTPAAWLERGQWLEAQEQFGAAIAAYDEAIAALGRVVESGLDPDRQRLLGLAWMNRGNALQKIPTVGPRRDAVDAYDRAIAVFKASGRAAEPQVRNHLGAAWLNRGHALLMTEDPRAVESFEAAIRELAELPLEASPFYRLNLAGAWTNLAHALLAAASVTEAERSRSAARRALEILEHVEASHHAFAAMSLRARRAQVMALGELLMAAEHAGVPTAELATEATDVIDDGLAIARAYEKRGVPELRPLALRLFRLGAHLYRVHQPQFLGEFVLENVATAAFVADPAFLTAGQEAVAQALSALQQPQPLVAGQPATEKLLAIARSLRAAAGELTAFA